MKRALLLLTLALGTTACGGRESSSIDSKLVEGVYADAIPVETLALQARAFEDRFDAAGMIEAEEEVTISSELSGRVLRVHYEIGDRVKRGNLLVSIDDSEIRARIRRIEAQLEKARTQLLWARKDQDRQERLFSTQVTAERALDDATRLVDTSEDEVQAAEADLELAEVELGRCSIRSPITGSIATRHLAAGEFVREGTAIYDIVATDEVKFVFSLAERDVTAVENGQLLPIRIDAFDEVAFEGPVRTIAPAGAKQTRTFRVEITLANDGEHRLLPGMSGRTEVVRRRFDNVFLLPEESILRDAEGSYVYLADAASAVRAPVRILSQIGDKAVVSSDLGAGRDAIILGQAAVSPETAIRVRRRHEAIPETRFD
jgi:membrane fusion protein (multidrug efflux system)